LATQSNPSDDFSVIEMPKSIYPEIKKSPAIDTFLYQPPGCSSKNLYSIWIFQFNVFLYH